MLREPKEKFYCPECLEEVDKSAIECPHCGVTYEEGEEEAGFECMICGTEVAPDAKHCSLCGTLFLNDVEDGDPLVRQLGDHGKNRRAMKDMELDDS